MQRRAIFSALLLALFALAACRTAPIYNPSGVALGAPAGASLAEVTKAIQQAGASLGWEMTEVGPGEVRARLRNRRHTAEALVRVDTETFSISYQSSENLRHEGDTIHKGYNKWIRTLERRIVLATGLMVTS